MREKPKAVHGTSVGAAIAGAFMQVTHPSFTPAAWPPVTSKAKLWMPRTILLSELVALRTYFIGSSLKRATRLMEGRKG